MITSVLLAVGLSTAPDCRSPAPLDRKDPLLQMALERRLRQAGLASLAERERLGKKVPPRTNNNLSRILGTLPAGHPAGGVKGGQRTICPLGVRLGQQTRPGIAAVDGHKHRAGLDLGGVDAQQAEHQHKYKNSIWCCCCLAHLLLLL